MNIIRFKYHFIFVRLFIPIAVFIFVCSGKTTRSEISQNFIRSSSQGSVKIDNDLISIDAKQDIPELFEQKFSVTEKIASDSVEQEINGFRIQIYKTEDLTSAKRRESIYINNFGEENVVLLFEPPFYKIRIGRLRDRDEDEVYQNRLRNRGFNNTIIVPDVVKVLVPVQK